MTEPTAQTHSPHILTVFRTTNASVNLAFEITDATGKVITDQSAGVTLQQVARRLGEVTEGVENLWEKGLPAGHVEEIFNSTRNKQEAAKSLLAGGGATTSAEWSQEKPLWGLLWRIQLTPPEGSIAIDCQLPATSCIVFPGTVSYTFASYDHGIMFSCPSTELDGVLGARGHFVLCKYSGDMLRRNAPPGLPFQFSAIGRYDTQTAQQLFGLLWKQDEAKNSDISVLHRADEPKAAHSRLRQQELCITPTPRTLQLAAMAMQVSRFWVSLMLLVCSLDRQACNVSAARVRLPVTSAAGCLPAHRALEVEASKPGKEFRFSTGSSMATLVQTLILVEPGAEAACRLPLLLEDMYVGLDGVKCKRQVAFWLAEHAMLLWIVVRSVQHMQLAAFSAGVSLYGADKCDIKISPKIDATRDDLVNTGFIPADFKWPIHVKITSISCTDFDPSSICPPTTPGVQWTAPPMKQLFLTLTTMEELSAQAVASASSSGFSGMFSALIAGLAACCCCCCCAAAAWQMSRKRTDWESGTSSESESDGYPAPGQMAYARPMQPPVPGQGPNPYWQGSAPQGPPQPAPYAGAAYATGAPYVATSFVQGSPQAYPAPFQSGEGFAWAGFGNGGFMDTAAPSGASWANVCRQHPVNVNGSTMMVDGAWGECLAWAVVYEHQNPGWESDPRFKDEGPAQQVINAMLETAPESMAPSIEMGSQNLGKGSSETDQAPNRCLCFGVVIAAREYFFPSDLAIMIAMPVIGRSLAALGLLVLACRAQQGGISGNSGVWYYINVMDIICPGGQGHATLSVTQPAVLSSDPTIFTIFRTTMNPVTLSFIARDATGRTVVDQSAPITLQAVTARPGRRLEEEEEEETKEVAMRGLDSRRRSSFSSPRRRMSSPRRRSMTDSRRRAVLDSRRRTADTSPRRRTAITSPRRRLMTDTRRRSSFFSPRRRRGGSGSFVPNNHYSNPLSPSIGNYGYTNPNYAYHNYGGHMPMSTSYGYTGANAYSSGSGMKIALAGGAGILAGLATSHLLHHSGGSSFGGYTHAQMMQQDCTYGSWSGNCNSCVSQYGANRCDVSISPNFDATRDDLMSTGFIPTQVSWPLTVTVTSVSGVDFQIPSVCPLTPGSAGNPSVARLFLTTTSLGLGSSGGVPGPGYSQPTNYGYNSGQQSSSSSGSGFFAWLGTVLALCCCCGFCVCCSCASGKKPSKWGFSGDSSSSDSESESVQMVHHGGHNPYWQGQAPAPGQTNTAFMDTAAPGGATWANYCRGPPEVNPSTGFVAGRWGDCLAWAVVYEHQNPGWPQNPTYRDMGPAGTVIQAMLENAEDSDCEDVERAANQLENACREAVASGGMLPVINCRA
ncbi:GND [Symbiodinium sp. CCMP2456]|nr:GND [Symbiodinium sp. CCMP2456]